MSRRYAYVRYRRRKVYRRYLSAADNHDHAIMRRRYAEAWLIEEKMLEVFIRRRDEEGFA
jgi:hypothetical protein